MNKILQMLVTNQPEVLMRITGLLRKRGFNMKSISMVETSDPSLAYLTIMTDEENKCVQQAIHQVQKCIDVHKISCLDNFEGIKKQWDTMKKRAKEMDLDELLHVMDELDDCSLFQLAFKETAMCSTF